MNMIWIVSGGKLPPLGGSSLPPITGAGRYGGAQSTAVPPLGIKTSPRIPDSDSDDDKW